MNLFFRHPAPVRAFLIEGIPVGLGADVGRRNERRYLCRHGNAIQASRELRWRGGDDN